MLKQKILLRIFWIYLTEWKLFVKHIARNWYTCLSSKQLLSFFLFNFLMCLVVLPACMCMCSMCGCVDGAAKGQKWIFPGLNQEFWMVISCYVDVGNWILVLCKNNKCFELPSCYSSSSTWVLERFLCVWFLWVCLCTA